MVLPSWISVRVHRRKSLTGLDINSYIKSDKSLDYQRIYRDMEEITGFMAQKRREQHYHTVVGLFESLNNGEILHNAGENADTNANPF